MVHRDHRQRMRKRIQEQGAQTLNDHEALEALLYYVIPVKDVNPLAHRLILEFGSYSRVFEATLEELMAVKEVGEKTAFYLYLLGKHCQRTEADRISYQYKNFSLDTPEKMAAYITPRFHGMRDEAVLLVCLDAKRRPICCEFLSQGTVNATEIQARRIAELAMLHKADSIVLAHNHPRGNAEPSQADVESTKHIHQLLQGVGIFMIEHLVIGENDWVALSQVGGLTPYRR